MNKTSSKPNSPSKSPKKQPQPISQENVSNEFCSRVLGLMTSFYEPTNFVDFLDFPEIEKNEQTPQNSPKQQEKKIAFNSAIAELRYKKLLDTQKELSQSYNEKFSQTFEDFNKNCAVNNFEEFELSFMPPQAERPEVPLYMTNQQKDLEIIESKRVPVKPINAKEIEQEMKAKLKSSKQRGVERSRQRIMRLMKRIPEKKEIIHDAQWRGLSPAFGARMNYKPENGYPVEKKRKEEKSPTKITYYQED